MRLYRPGGQMACELAKNPTVLIVNDSVFAHGGVLSQHGGQCAAQGPVSKVFSVRHGASMSHPHQYLNNTARGSMLMQHNERHRISGRGLVEQLVCKLCSASAAGLGTSEFAAEMLGLRLQLITAWRS
jgi:hypothetical protein